jgi:hypothetical protein
MSITDSLKPELRFILIFSIAALILSFFIGVISGIEVHTVIIRSIISGVVFAGIAYAAVFILKRYVPELYEIIFQPEADSSTPEIAPDNKGGGTFYPDEGSSSESTGGDAASAGDSSLDGFKEYLPEEFPRYETGDEKPAGRKPGPGKHIVVEEKLAKYEPKIMAQAVRTMLRKDD